MTIGTHPDYSVKLKLSRDNFEVLSGISLIVSVLFESSENTGGQGSLTIPKSNSFTEDNFVDDSWLWVENCRDMPSGTRLQIQLCSYCEPMRMPGSVNPFESYVDMVITGEVTRNWHAELGTSR